MYDVRRANRRDETVKGVGIAAGVSLMLYTFVFFLAPTEKPRVGVGVFIALAAILTLTWRFIYIAIFTQPDFLRRVLIVGAGRAGSGLAAVCRAMVPQPFHLVGLIDDDPDKRGQTIEGVPVLGGGNQLMELVEREKISDVIFAISNQMHPEMFQALLTAEESGVEITTMPIVYEQLIGRVPIFLLNSDWIIRSFVDQVHANAFYEMIKRLIDIVGGLVGTIAYLVLYPLISIATVLDSGRPVLYKQTRLGLNGREYMIIKFRTMRQDSEKDGKVRVTVENDERITRVGKILRKSHLDELPQFVNVLRGEMSLIGPRAERSELVNNLQNKVPFYRARLLVKPGITGWAQVNFGYAATVEDTAIKLEYDLYYIKHRNLMLDMFILFRTVGTVVGFKGQ
jgi:exopolysaccharide biosynthesis polyprenyl glycosylphosphotransferase